MTKKPNYDKKYYKFTFEDENHRGFTYKDGLNIDIYPFNYTDTCCVGGLYFSDAKNIMDFFDVSNGSKQKWIREIKVPKKEKKFVRDPDMSPIKWRAHSVICKKRKSLYVSSTWKWMLDQKITFTEESIGYVLNRLYINTSNKTYSEVLRLFNKHKKLNSYIEGTLHDSSGRWSKKSSSEAKVMIKYLDKIPMTILDSVIPDLMYDSNNLDILKLIFKHIKNIKVSDIKRWLKNSDNNYYITCGNYNYMKDYLKKLEGKK